MVVDSFTLILQPTEAPRPLRLARRRIPPLCEYTHTHGHRFPQSLHADTRTDTHAAVFPIISSPPSLTRHPFSVPLQLHVEGFNPGDTTLLLKREKEGMKRIKNGPRAEQMNRNSRYRHATIIQYAEIRGKHTRNAHSFTCGLKARNWY